MFLVSFIFVFYFFISPIYNRLFCQPRASIFISFYIHKNIVLRITHAVLTVAHTPFIRDIHYYNFKYLFDNQFQVLFINLINRHD